MDLQTPYLGLTLAHPIMVGSSPLADDLDMVRRLEDAGTAAIVMRSLFEEQITGDPPRGGESYPPPDLGAGLAWTPHLHDFALGPDEYLEQIRHLKNAVSVPVIASLNGTRPGEWLRYAGLIQEAGADALELNFYLIATDPDLGAQDLEDRVVTMVQAVLDEVRIPVSVKLSPFFTALASFARRLDRTGIRGLVLFNRFYQPDIRPEEFRVVPALSLSEPSELLLRIRWLAILCDRIVSSLAVTGGVHDAGDAIKAIMAGANAVQLVSAILRHGPERISILRDQLGLWMEEREFESVTQMRGTMSLLRCPDPREFERGNYLRVLQSWQEERQQGLT